MDVNKDVLAVAGIQYAINALKAGMKVAEVGVGERDFYVDIVSRNVLSLDEAKKLAKFDPPYEYTVAKGRVDTPLGSFNLAYQPSIRAEPKHFEILNVSVHHPEPGLQYVRVRGVGFEREEELKDYLKWLEEAQEIDHRLIGERLDLFSFHEEAGPGLALFHPKGQIIRKELIKYIEEVEASMGFQEVYTTHVYRTVLWKISGHYNMYRDKMLMFEHEGDELGIKPMNCPAHILIYKSRMRSYRDLPLRFAEFGHVYRWEKKGELYGLLRVRGFVQDDGHIFCTEDQLKDEVKMQISKTIEVLRTFGFKEDDIAINLSTRPDESIGTDEQWEKATNALISALSELGLKYRVKEKEGAFYGPKIDFDIRDSLNRWWQLSTIQVDFNLPERFDLEYVDRDGQRRRPVMVHRAIYGSIERFMAILLEHFRGKLPTWLSPVQVRVLPISEEVLDYANSVLDRLRSAKVRADLDASEGTLGKKIRDAYAESIPYLVIVGRKEKESGTVTVRGRNNVEVRGVKLEDFLRALGEEIASRALEQTAIKALSGK
ncbi:MAG: threonine--tRNA ligase [Sulfolobales archaeon]|nr:threonine--tRNA ligase [Sulfolobales archaeon]